LQAVLDALNFNVWSFLFQIINLLLVIGILYKLMYQPILKMVSDREERIESSLANAEKASTDAQQKLDAYEAKLQSAREEAQSLVERAAKQAEAQRQETVSQAQEEAAKTLARAREEIEGEKNKALNQIREEVAGLAVLAASKVIDKTITEEDQKALVKEFVSEVGRLQ